MVMMLREEDKIKIRTAVTVLLMQNPKGLTAKELSQKLNEMPLGIRKNRGFVTSTQVSHYLKAWTGYTSKDILKKERSSSYPIKYSIRQ